MAQQLKLKASGPQAVSTDNAQAPPLRPDRLNKIVNTLTDEARIGTKRDLSAN